MGEPTEDILQRLAAAFADRQLFLVGGCVRDQLLERQISDLDLATDALPPEIRRRVSPWADSVWLIGEKFGTVGVMKDGTRAEITTFRADQYDGNSRKPEVTFGCDILGDLQRRDFTINAMARNLHTGELLDPFDGRRHLGEQLVSFVDDPQQRIAEDPLRMLRAVRFCAQLGFELAPETAAAIAVCAAEIRRISWERIRDELDAILLSSRPADNLRLLAALGLTAQVLPELLQLSLPAPARHQMKDLLDHTLDTVSFTPPSKPLRYAALLHDIAKPETFTSDGSGVHFHRHEDLGAEKARAILSRLRQPAALSAQVASLIRHHLRIPYYGSEWTDSAVRRLLFDLGDQVENAIALADADVRASQPIDYPEFRARLGELRNRMGEIGAQVKLAEMRPLLNGQEVMSLLGIGPGPRVGEVLDYLLDQQIEGTITTRERARESVLSKFGS